MPRAAKKPWRAAAAKKPRRAAAAKTSVTAIDAVEDQGEEYRDWAQLLPDLVSKIADDLLSDDVTEYIRLRAVCKPWRSSAADPSRLDPRFFPRKWLLLAQEKLRRDGKPERFVNVSTGAELRILLPEPQEYTHHGNAEGLLVLFHADTDTVCLLNPLTMAFTDLPTMAAVHALDDKAAVLNAYNIKAAGVVVGNEAPANPTVVLSLNSRAHTAIVCAEPGGNVWRAVDTSCTDDIECELPAIMGGLSVQGRFFVPTRQGDVLEVELRPQPRLTFVARQDGENAESGLNGKSYLLPFGTDDYGNGMLLLRASRRPRNGYYQAFTVDLGNGRLTRRTTRSDADITMFLPSVTVRTSVFPGLVPNMAYQKHKMRKLL